MESALEGPKRVFERENHHTCSDGPCIYLLYCGNRADCNCRKRSKDKKSSGSISKQEKETKTAELMWMRIFSGGETSRTWWIRWSCKAIYFKLHIYDVYRYPEMTTKRVKTESGANDPTPSVIIKRADTAWDLLNEVNSKKINSDKLQEGSACTSKTLPCVRSVLWCEVLSRELDNKSEFVLLARDLLSEIPVYNGLGLYHKHNNALDVELLTRNWKLTKRAFCRTLKRGRWEWWK